MGRQSLNRWSDVMRNEVLYITMGPNILLIRDMVVDVGIVSIKAKPYIPHKSLL